MTMIYASNEFQTLEAVHRIFKTGAPLLLISSSHAFDPTGYEWKHQEKPVSEVFTVCMTGFPVEAKARLMEAAKEWNYENSTFSFGPDNCPLVTSFPPSAPDGVLLIDMGPLLSGNIAETAVMGDTTSGYITECDIRFSSGHSWHFESGPAPNSQYDFLSVAIHEFGHCLGLDHSTTSSAVMYDIISPGTKNRTLGSDDIAGREFIYGR